MRPGPSAFTVLTILAAALFARPVQGNTLELWVAPNGSNFDIGSSNAPLHSLEAALDNWRTWTGTSKHEATNVVRIILNGGIYTLIRPISLQTFTRPPFPTNLTLSIEAAPGQHPVLSGGLPIKNWQKLDRNLPNLPAAAQNHVWVASIPRFNGHFLKLRQLWVNDTKAVLARQPKGEDLARLVAWDKTNQAATIPAEYLAGMTQPKQLEMVVDQVWEIANLRVKSIHMDGTNALLTFNQPESQLEFHHPWPPVTVTAKYQAPFYLANALEFLDQPGEWFEDLANGKIYYWPRTGEDMANATVIAPALETLLQVEGPTNQPTASIQFKGLTFAHTTWLRPSQQGHVPLQAGMFLLEARKLSPKGTPYHPGLDNLDWIGRPPAAVSVKNAAQITFEVCTFTHLASAGLDFISGTHNNLVEGCTFSDIGGNGIQLGKFSDTNVETHVPYNPSNPSEICHDEKISNNLITNCGNEDWGCVGIAVGYAQHIVIAHNEIFNLPYTGINVGWGWTKMTNSLRDNLVFANHVHHVGRRLGDLGGIYLLSAQPGTVVAENAISDMDPSPYVPDPHHWYYLYLDEGSSFITVRDNWCPADNFLKNANGPGNVWTNNGPQVSAAIKNAAGLEPAFKHLLPTTP